MSNKYLSGRLLDLYNKPFFQEFIALKPLFAESKTVAYALASSSRIKQLIPGLVESDRLELDDRTAALIRMQKQPDGLSFQLWSIVHDRALIPSFWTRMSVQLPKLPTALPLPPIL
jgi:hypothetical protein